MPSETSQTEVGDFAWTPSTEQLATANVARLARSLGCETYEELHRLSLDEPDRFWRAVVDDLGIPLASELGRRPRRLARDRVDDVVRRRPAQRRGGVRAPLGQRDADQRRPSGRRRKASDARSRGPSSRTRCAPRRGAARARRRAGRRGRDRSCRWRPRRRSRRTRARTSERFRSRSSPGSPGRLCRRGWRTPGAKVVVTADASYRRGRVVPMKEVLDEALAEAPSVERVVVWQRGAGDVR